MINPPQEITIDMIHEAYPTAMKVHNQPNTLKDGVEHLVKQMGMNESSAKIYINFILKLKTGELQKSKMRPSLPALSYFLKKIFDDSNEAGLSLALDALHKHIKHRKSFGQKMVGCEKIHAEFSAKLK